MSLTGVIAEFILVCSVCYCSSTLWKQSASELKVAAILALLVAVAAATGAARYSGMDLVTEHQWLSRFAGHIGMAGFIVTCGIYCSPVARKNVYLVLYGVSLLGYALHLGVLKDVAILLSLGISAYDMRRAQQNMSYFYAGVSALLVAGGLGLTGLTPGGIKESLFHLLLSVTIVAISRQTLLSPNRQPKEDNS